MTELRIDAGKAERIITQILRDEKGIPPADVVAVAASICRRLTTAMPTSPSLDRYRIIRESLQMARISRLQWPKSSLKGRVSVGTRANFGSLFTIKVAIFGRTSHGRSSPIFSVAEWSGIARHRPAHW